MNTRTVLLLFLASLLFAACSAPAVQPTEAVDIPTIIPDSSIITEGRLEPIRSASIAFTASGRISEVLVKEGQAVKQGDTLIRLGDETDVNYASARLELIEARQALNNLKDSAATDLAQAVIDLKEAQEAYDDALDDLNDLKNNQEILQVQNYRVPVKTSKGYKYEVRTKTVKAPAAKEWIVEAENELGLRQAELDAAQETYERLKDGVDVQQLAVREARLNAAQAALAAFSVTAPFDGVVAELPAKQGSSIDAGETAITVADFSQWVVKTTDLTEIDVVNLSEGGAVAVSLDAIPGEELRGTILSIGQTYAENQGDVVYDVTVLLTDTHPAMRWGMTAAVTFEALE